MKTKIVIIAVFLVVAFGAVAWNMYKGEAPEATSIPITSDNTQDQLATKDLEMGEWKTYQNKEVGISFQYPDIFERVDIRVVNGDTGRMFIGVLEFVPNHWISFGGVTKDFRVGKGGSITGTVGYEKRDDRYFLKFIWGENEVVPSEFWPVNGGTDQAIVIRNTEIGQILSPEQIAAFVNIPHSPFSGLVIEVGPEYAGESVDEKEVEILRQIVSSLTFI